MHEIQLYVLGVTQELEKDLTELKVTLRDEFQDQYFLSVIDLLKNSKLADYETIFATPKLIQHLSPSIKEIMGDMYIKHKILVGVNLINRVESL